MHNFPQQPTAMHNKSRRRKKNRIDLQQEQATVAKKITKKDQKQPTTTQNVQQ